MSDQEVTVDDMWLAARTIWENTTKITDSDLMSQLRITYGDLVPKSNGTVSKKRKSDEWVKNNLESATKRSENVEKSAKTRKKSSGKKQKNSTETNKAQSWKKTGSLEEKKGTIDDIMDNIVIDADGKAKIIKDTRRRFAKAGRIFDSALDITLTIPGLADEAEAAQERVNEYLNNGDQQGSSNPVDFEIGDKTEQLEYLAESALNRAKKAIMLSGVLTDRAKDITAGLKLLAEVNMPLCGITADNFVQSAQSIRMGAIEALGDINEKEDAARERLNARMTDRLRRFEAYAASDDFGRTEQSNNDDIDDVDYTAIED